MSISSQPAQPAQSAIGQGSSWERRGEYRSKGGTYCSGRVLSSKTALQRQPRRSYCPLPLSPELLRRLLRAKDQLDRAPQEEWPVSRLAAISLTSKAHFARMFKQAFGLPPHRYLLTRRIERAAALLGETNASVTEIAFETGWQSIGTFGRVFRDVTGATPGERRSLEREMAAPLKSIPECFVRAVRRPQLITAVSEKRRLATPRSNGRTNTEAT